MREFIAYSARMIESVNLERLRFPTFKELLRVNHISRYVTIVLAIPRLNTKVWNLRTISINNSVLCARTISFTIDSWAINYKGHGESVWQMGPTMGKHDHLRADTHTGIYCE